MLGAVPPRADARDALVGCRLAELPAGALIATGSARRRAQLAYLRPDLVFRDLRGNMARRVAAAGTDGVTAVVVAVAAMERLGWLDQVTDVLDPMDVLPQAGQGVDRRAVPGGRRADPRAVGGDRRRRRPTAALRAERAVLAALGGSCSVPVGAYAEPVAGRGSAAAPTLRVSGLVASADGHTLIRLSRQGDDPEARRGRGGAGAARGRRRGDRGLRPRGAESAAAARRPTGDGVPGRGGPG